MVPNNHTPVLLPPTPLAKEVSSIGGAFYCLGFIGLLRYLYLALLDKNIKKE